METKKEYRVIGKSFPRKDGMARVQGLEEYTSDVLLPRMLYGRAIRSPHPHARIKRIDKSGAENMGAICITPEDIPKVKYCERIASTPETTYRDRFVLAEKAVHVGEAVAAVAAETPAKADDAARKVVVEYEPLPALLDPYEAIEPGRPLIHEYVGVGREEKKVENNIACTREIVIEDITKGFAEADIVIEEEFKTGRAYHAALETRSVVCRYEADGGVTVWGTTQSIHNVRILLGNLFNIPLSKINVKRVAVGGGFGGSIHMNSIFPVGVALSLKARRSVKMVLTREEDLYDHCKYPSQIWLKLGVKRDGKLVAGHMKVLVDIGGHNTQAYHLLGCMAGWWVSLYKLPALKFEGQAVYTNKVPCCAMQGFGNPQVNFAVESMIDMLAEKLGMDPVELRLKNYVGLGDTFWGQGPTVKSVIQSCGVEEMFEKGMELSGWKDRPAATDQSGPIRRGLGMARGFHTSGTGAPNPGEVIDYSSALVKINEDGSVDLLTALMDPGGGGLDAGAKIVAEELGVPLENVNISPADTRTTLYDVATHASRGVYCGGGAIQVVAQQTRQKLLDFASRILEAEPADLEITTNPEIGQGVVFVRGVPTRRLTIGEVARTAQFKGWGTIAAADCHRMNACPPAFTTYFIGVEVNIETGEVRPIRAILCCDAGTPINPDLLAGQLHGGFYRGLSFAMIEDTPYRRDTGELVNQGFLTDYKMLTASDLPMTQDIITYFAKTFEPTGPFGAKGIGEAALNPVPAALANAIYQAIGIRFTELPITPEKVLWAIREKEKSHG